MKLIDKKEVRVVQVSDATAFEHEVNRVLETLADDGLDVQVQIDTSPLTAVITYTRHLKIPEDVRDEYHLKGIYKHCRDCEQFVPDEDGRRKTGRCRAHSRLTDKNDSACELYYEMKERWGE